MPNDSDACQDIPDLYENAESYWKNVQPDVSGMLGGLTCLADADVVGSTKFISHMKKKLRLQCNRAIDCGSGIGRVTKLVLLPFFDTVDMVDVTKEFMESSKRYIGSELEPKIGLRSVCGLQDYQFRGRYDVIWCQWVLGHLNDSDLISFLLRCGKALTPTGFLVLKENVCTKTVLDFDSEDSSWTRSRPLWLARYADAGLDVCAEKIQRNFPDGLYEVFDRTPDGNWVQSASWKCHTGSVWKLSWAHPEFGQIIAICSFDRTVSIWEEFETGNWIRRTQLVDSCSNVTDVKFGPKHLGLVLACCATDGLVRIYDAPDAMNLGQWNINEHQAFNSARETKGLSINAKQANFSQQCSCLSWNPSRYHAPMLAVGSTDGPDNAVKLVIIQEGSESQQKKWNKLPNTAGLFTGPVHDLSFAPSLGRSFHILAVASSSDVGVVLFSLKPSQSESSMLGGGGDPSSSYVIEKITSLVDHQCVVWRVSWNVTGTVLASSGENGTVMLWKQNYLKNWKNVYKIRPDDMQLPYMELAGHLNS